MGQILRQMGFVHQNIFRLPEFQKRILIAVLLCELAFFVEMCFILAIKL